MHSKIRKQFEHSLKTKDDICKFNSLWISFNCFYNIEINKGSDRDNIDEIKTSNKFKEVFIGLETSIKRDFFNFINDRPNKGIKNLKNNKINTYQCLDCFSEFIEIVYTIRNNQFHGGKDWESESDIYLLIEVNKIFEVFLHKIYKEYSIL